MEVGLYEKVSIIFAMLFVFIYAFTYVLFVFAC